MYHTLTKKLRHPAQNLKILLIDNGKNLFFSKHGKNQLQVAAHLKLEDDFSFQFFADNFLLRLVLAIIMVRYKDTIR